MFCWQPKGLQNILQIAIYEGLEEFKMILRSSSSMKRALSMYLYDIF